MNRRRFLPGAEHEMLETARFYESKKPGLGRDFLDEVERTITSAEKRPYLGARHSDNIRRRILRRFPFGVLYAVEPDRIIIVAVMHLHRYPGYWRDRLNITLH